jgi:integrase
MRVEDFLDYVREAKSKATFKNYVQGLKKFVKWYGKNPNTILKERFEDLQTTDQNKRKRFNREIEKFHRHLKREGKTQNTAVAYTEGIRALFRFFDMDIKDLPTEVTRKVTTVKDYVPTVQQYRDMFNCGNVLDRTIISMALDLAWRIGDFVSIKKDTLPNLEQQAPIPFSLITEKEEVVSKSFLSAQTVQLLKTYVRTLPKDNPYLFPNGNGSHYDPEAIGKRLKVLAKKAKIHIPKGRRLRFHCFRKRFLSECANLKIDINTAKILVGKSVSKDMLTYLSEVQHAKAFSEVHERLRLTEVKAVVNAKDKEIEALKKK